MGAESRRRATSFKRMPSSSAKGRSYSRIVSFMAHKPAAPSELPKISRHKDNKSNKRSKSPLEPTLRQLTKQLPEPDEFENIEREILGASDRSAAIILAARVELELEKSIIGSLPRSDKETVEKLTTVGGPLNGFFAKIHLGYAMGLYSIRRRDELDVVRRIRNCFAHSAKAVTFDTKQVAEECYKLDKNLKKLKGLSNRDKYTRACEFLSGIMLVHTVIQTVSELRNKFPNAREIDEEAADTIDKVFSDMKRKRDILISW